MTTKPKTLNVLNVLITTEHRGVFFARVSRDLDLTAATLHNLKDCRMAISWRTGRGVMDLAENGPNDKCLISSKADILVIHKVTAVFAVTDAAALAWDNWAENK
jgi:hypothetical protein